MLSTKITAVFLAALSSVLTAQMSGGQNVPLRNWPAPLYWQPPQNEPGAPTTKLAAEVRSGSPEAVLKTGPLVFVAMTPCRVVDTRLSQGFAAPFGAPALMPGPERSFPIQSSPLCPIPATAQAYSLTVTVVPSGSLGYLILWPSDQPQPNAVTLDDTPGDIRNTAAIVPAATVPALNGSISAVVNGNTDLVIDINGYYVYDLGNGNTALGNNALVSNTTGNTNTAIGFNALQANTAGTGNIAIGVNALEFNTSGSFNLALGKLAGWKIGTGSNNIDIANSGVSGDNGAIRIGDDNAQTSFFAAGIRGWQTGFSNAVNVLIDSHGQLGTINSSRRFKEDIQDMNDASSALMQLRPVTYRYRQPYADGSKPLDYGLIAEEVAEVYPGLVAQSSDGQIETVQYHKLTPMLLNEVQKLQAQVVALRKELNDLRSGQ